jgi:hypothetical protein
MPIVQYQIALFGSLIPVQYDVVNVFYAEVVLYTGISVIDPCPPSLPLSL